MSIEFEDFEEPLSRLGTFILIIATSVLVIMSGMICFPLLIVSTKAGGTIVSRVGLATGYRFLYIFIVTLIIEVLAIFAFIRNWIKFQINVFGASIIQLILFILIILAIPGDVLTPTGFSLFQTFIWIGIGSIIAIFIGKRPNLGKESNKHIYQAYGAVIEFVVGIFLIALGIYVVTIDISAFAGHGTFPGGFETEYIQGVSSIRVTYQAVKASGVIMIVGGTIICITSLIRNIITLKVAAGFLVAGIIIGLVGISFFNQNWETLDARFKEKYPDEYQAQLSLSDPIIVNLGIVLVLLLFIGLFMIVYASTQSEPLEKWKAKRNHMLAAAEVAIRDQKLGKGIKYLEQASIWSSKLGEEDRAVELITRINNIKEKAIKMRKAEASEKKKRELEAAKKKADKKSGAVKKIAATKAGQTGKKPKE